MKARSFGIGGAHLPEFKHTAAQSIRVILPNLGEELIFPVSQHIGAHAAPTVEVGERVLVGQKIADAGGHVSSPVHASVSGTVKAVEPRIAPGGLMIKSVVVENDALMEESKDINIPHDLDSMSRQQCIDVIKEAGIVGLGGAGFPAHVKLSPPSYATIDFVILNACECEPYLTTDHRVLLEEGERILRGFRIMLKLFPAAKGLIAIETNKGDAIKYMKRLVKDEPRIEVVPLDTKYPQGSEKQTIYACTRREVPSGGLPSDVGCIVNNVDTVMAYDRAIHRGRPLMRRVVTLDGGALNCPGNFKVRIGQTLSNLVAATGGFRTKPAKLIAGGPMMGLAIFDLNVPVIKTTSALLCFTEAEAVLPEETTCIRCARCVGHCPMGLEPYVLNHAVITGEIDKFLKNNGLDCIECGCCSFVCPSKRHLAQSIRYMRRDCMSKKRK